EIARFSVRSQARIDLDFAHDVYLTIAATDAVLRGRPVSAVLNDIRQERERLKQVQAALSDFRIYWDTMAGSLMGRELVLIDADNVKGQRNLFLFDVDQMRTPVILPPNLRLPPRPDEP